MIPNGFRGPVELKFGITVMELFRIIPRQGMRMPSVCYEMNTGKYNCILALCSPPGFSSLQTDEFIQGMVNRPNYTTL